MRTQTGLLAVAIVGLMTSFSSGAAPRSAPMPVAGFRGQYCYSMGPRGWAVIAENPQRVAFGADFLSGDGKAAASYGIFGTGSLNPMPGFENPDRAVMASVTLNGSRPARYGRKQQLAANVFVIPFQTAQTEGMAFWQVIPTQMNGYMVVLRTAYTATGYWRSRGAEASAVVRSLRCNVPSMPPAADPPGLNHAPEGKKPDGEQDSEYNVWLDREYYHNAQSGENYWVSPSQDWDQNGKEGPGYYAKYGNDIVKLQSGYAQ